MTDIALSNPWDRQPDEPLEWYARFHIFLMLGPSRTITAAFRTWTDSDGSLSGTASKMASDWRWKERAIAYDQAKREEKAALEQTRADAARELRISLIRTLIDDTAAAIDTADLKNLSQKEARVSLSSLRLTLLAAIEQERRELQSGLPPAPDDHLGNGEHASLNEASHRLLEEVYSDA